MANDTSFGRGVSYSLADASSAGERFAWVDTARGVGICLVVLGHVLRGLVTSDILTSNAAIRFVDGWIYSFHMPLFFFLSGLFLCRSTRKSWGMFVSDKLRTIAYPYFVWSVLTLLIKTWLGNTVNRPYGISDLPRVFYDPIDQFWFLYVLFVLLIACSLLLKLRMRPAAIVAVAMLIYPGVSPIGPPGILTPLRLMAIYLAFGVVVGAELDLNTFGRIPLRWLLVVTLGGFTIAMLGGFPNLPYQQAFKPVLAVCGTAAAISLALLFGQMGAANGIQFMGRHSLEIYVLHIIAASGTRITLVRLLDVSDPAMHLALGLFAGIAGPVLVVLFLNKLDFPYGFSLPKHSL